MGDTYYLLQIRSPSCLPQHSVLNGLGIHPDVLLPQLPGLHRPAHHQRTLLPSNFPDTIHFRYVAIKGHSENDKRNYYHC